MCSALLADSYPTNERQKVTLKAFATDVIAISSTDPARLPVL